MPRIIQIHVIDKHTGGPLNRLAKLPVLIAVIASLAACASNPKLALKAESKQKIRTIAIVQAPEPARYFLQPGQLPGGAALYVFGALGGLVLGGIEATRAENATSEFNAALTPHTPALGSAWNDELFRLVGERGYTVTRIDPLPKAPDGQQIDCASVKGQYDAILVSDISGGYALESQAEPRVIAHAKLLSGDCRESMYAETLIYAARTFGKLTLVERNPEFAFPNREALFADLPKSKAALRAGASELAKRVALEL